jgi:hypothetical protein
MPRQTAIVVTTIFEPEFLRGYQENLEAHGRLDETMMYVIIDRKSPPSVPIAAAAARKRGFRVACPSLVEQDAFLHKLNIPADFIPYNSDNRRNIGYLMALAAGCDVLISIDDDNFCPCDSDFVGEHQAVGRKSHEPIVWSSDDWFNICSLLESGGETTIFPRGFPYAAQRASRRIDFVSEKGGLEIAINAGLWLDDPDVDAMSRLCCRPKIQRFVGPSAILGPDVWSPINTQNTALTRAAALTYYYVKMGYRLQGLSIDRFGDILSGYLTQKVVKHLGQGIRIGTPILDHRRTPHNLFKDLYHELAGIVLVEEFVPWLMELQLSGATSLDAYATLADEIAAGAQRFRGFVWDEGGREFLTETSQLMQLWIQAVRKLES